MCVWANARRQSSPAPPTEASSRPGSIIDRSGRVAQLARALPLQGRSRGFETLHAHSIRNVTTAKFAAGELDGGVGHIGEDLAARWRLGPGEPQGHDTSSPPPRQQVHGEPDLVRRSVIRCSPRWVSSGLRGRSPGSSRECHPSRSQGRDRHGHRWRSGCSPDAPGSSSIRP